MLKPLTQSIATCAVETWASAVFVQDGYDRSGNFAVVQVRLS